jgi:hypothetical protein
MHSFTIQLHGLPQRGLWRCDNADSLEVRTQYGTVWVDLGGRNPAEVAREVLVGLTPPPAHRPRLP